MTMKSLVFILLASVLIVNEVHGTALLKAKLVAAKAPFIASNIAVGKEIKFKAANAVRKGFEAAKAAGDAVVSVVTAPFRVVKKTVGLKLGAIKAVKAIKVAKVLPLIHAKAAPFIGAKSAPFGVPQFANNPLPQFKFPALPTIPTAPAGNIFSAFSETVKNLPFLKAPTTQPPPVFRYRFVPDLGFTNYNRIDFNPRVNIEVPAATPSVVGDIDFKPSPLDAAAGPVEQQTFGQIGQPTFINNPPQTFEQLQQPFAPAGPIIRN